MKIFEGSDASEFFQADDWTRRDELAAWFMAARIANGSILGYSALTREVYDAADAFLTVRAEVTK